MSGVRPSALANAGLLSATLIADGVELLDVNMVVQVSREEKDGSFMRCILSPLE